MSRFLRTSTLLLFVAACGSANYTAPRNLDNACSITEQRPKFLKAMQRTERRWGVPVGVQMAFIYQESKFIGNARTPRKYTLGIIPAGRQSSAYGYSQVLDGTWKEYRHESGRFGARRDNINDATDFIGWYMHGSQKRLGISKTDARAQYLAYHEGRAGYARGNHRNKPWLLKVADDVAERASLYQGQLSACGKL